MKIRLTESQYKRLLSEDSDDRLWDLSYYIQKEVGEKITKFIAKLFININEVDKITPQMMESERPYGYRTLVDKIKSITGYRSEPSLLLAHNYIKYYDLIKNGDVDGLIGQPLEFYAKFELDMPLHFSGNLSGTGSGRIEEFATSPEEFYDMIEQGEYEINDIDVDVAHDPYDIYWELNSEVTRDEIDNNFEKIGVDEISWEG